MYEEVQKRKSPVSIAAATMFLGGVGLALADGEAAVPTWDAAQGTTLTQYSTTMKYTSSMDPKMTSTVPPRKRGPNKNPHNRAVSTRENSLCDSPDTGVCLNGTAGFRRLNGTTLRRPGTGRQPKQGSMQHRRASPNNAQYPSRSTSQSSISTTMMTATGRDAERGSRDRSNATGQTHP